MTKLSDLGSPIPGKGQGRTGKRNGSFLQLPELWDLRELRQVWHEPPASRAAWIWINYERGGCRNADAVDIDQEVRLWPKH